MRRPGTRGRLPSGGRPRVAFQGTGDGHGHDGHDGHGSSHGDGHGDSHSDGHGHGDAHGDAHGHDDGHGHADDTHGADKGKLHPITFVGLGGIVSLLLAAVIAMKR